MRWVIGAAAWPRRWRSSEARAVGRITLVDHDTVDVTNLQSARSRAQTVAGRPAPRRIGPTDDRAINPEVQVDAVIRRADAALLGWPTRWRADVALDRSDNFATRQAG